MAEPNWLFDDVIWRSLKIYICPIRSIRIIRKTLVKKNLYKQISQHKFAVKFAATGLLLGPALANIFAIEFQKPLFLYLKKESNYRKGTLMKPFHLLKL